MTQDSSRTSCFFSLLLPYSSLAIVILLLLSLNFWVLPVLCLKFVLLLSAPSDPTAGMGQKVERGAAHSAIRGREGIGRGPHQGQASGLKDI